MIQEPEPDRDLDLRRVAAVLWRRAWIIVPLIGLAAGAAFALAKQAPDRYQATAEVRISNPNANRLFSNQQSGPINADPRRLVETETRVLLADDIRSSVDQALGPAASLIDGVDVANPPDTDLLDVTVTSTSPAVARQAADVFADVYIARRRQETVSDLAARARELRARAEQLGGQLVATGPDDPLRVQLQTSQNAFLTLANQYEAEAGLLTSNVQVVDRARTPTEPVSPEPWRDAGVAGVLALLAGAGLALLLDRFDDRISTPDDLERALPGVPLLATIPVHDAHRIVGSARVRGRTRSLVPLRSVDAEAYRTLRSNIRFSSRARSHNVLMVTSPSGNEGKSTITANLAVSLAEDGQRVVLVSADLRRPALAGFFGVPETGAGLSSVLAGEARGAECLVPVTVGSGHRLGILPAGPAAPNPAELLGSGAMEALLRELAGGSVDFVIVDCPPVLPVSDPLAISQFVDSVILVSLAGRTRAHRLLDARRRLDRVGADVVGVVLNAVPAAHRSYGYYHHLRDTYDGPVTPRPPEAAPAGGNGSRPVDPPQEVGARPTR